jgi:hypothetical protein
MSKIKLEIFENRASIRSKFKFRSNFMDFAIDLMDKKTIKDVVRKIKEGVPKILGYQTC